MSFERATLLEGISSPADVKKLNFIQMEQLCAELRSHMIRAVSQTGGHLASNLGVVEITVALHKVFRSPTDQIVWDVGHQAYAHKMLTGRLEQFSTLRQEDGLAGFPKPCESEHDTFIAGHSSTSVSVASGLAAAKRITGEKGYAIAVIGDGSFTNGMVYEALNNAGRSRDKLIVILNDNEMSISSNVGAFARYLAKIRSKQEYFDVKDRIERGLKAVPLVGDGMYKAVATSKATLKDMLYKSNLFEDFGFTYLGPVNGHDVRSLCEVLRRAKELGRPVLIHAETVKGKGYSFAEKNPGAFHGVSRFDVRTGSAQTSGNNFSEEFGRALCSLAETDGSICAITAAMKGGTGLDGFAAAYPARFFDVGIAEEHGVTFSAGLARNGLKPVFAVYSTFLQRAYDQILHDTAIAPQHVVLAVDRAGVVGEDGETHQGLFDAAFLSNIPNVTVYSPATFAELRSALRKALYQHAGPVAVRYPRGGEPALPQELCAQEDFIFFGNSAAQTLIVTYGVETAQAYEAARRLEDEGRPMALLKLSRICPLPQESVTAALGFGRILFAEEGILQGGVAEHFGARLLEQGFAGQYRIRAVNGKFVPHAKRESALQKLGLDANGLYEAVKTEFGGGEA